MGGEKNSGCTGSSCPVGKDSAPGTRFADLLRCNRESRRGGIYSVCSAHPAVVKAAVQQCKEDGSLLMIESTASQVNQFGGYSGMMPRQFAEYVHGVARTLSLPAEQVLLGSDHAGPFPWRNEASDSAVPKACELVRECVLAGYQKIHLDASMACADDGSGALSNETIAGRAAVLCLAAEAAHRQLPAGSHQLRYVIGTEVPAPGGESAEGHPPAVTKPEDVSRTLEVFRQAFEEKGISSAWQKVIALVVQPGVEFGANTIFDYDRSKAQLLSAVLSRHPGIVYEAHSTDYQTVRALTEMVEDHFAILKVGPALTFAFREAVLALSAIERELFGDGSARTASRVREALDTAMLSNPGYWRSYYRGEEEEVRRDRIYAYSDRCRYYWNQPGVQAELGRLFDNLAAKPIPLALISQFLPDEYEAIRSGELETSAEAMIQHRIRRVLQTYASACSRTSKQGI